VPEPKPDSQISSGASVGMDTPVNNGTATTAVSLDSNDGNTLARLGAQAAAQLETVGITPAAGRVGASRGFRSFWRNLEVARADCADELEANSIELLHEAQKKFQCLYRRVCGLQITAEVPAKVPLAGERGQDLQSPDAGSGGVGDPVPPATADASSGRASALAGAG